MSFYAVTDYRKAIDYLILKVEAKGIKCNYSILAEKMRVQRPYLSKVMGKSADLSDDQLHLLCEYFELTEEEKEYLELLLQYSKSGIKERKESLKKRINKIQSIKLDIKNHIEAEQISPANQLFSDYFLNPNMQIVHVALNIKKYQNLENLKNALRISKKELNEIINKLEQLNLIKYQDKKYIVTEKHLHLPKNSHLIFPQQSLLRVKSLEQNQYRNNDGENYSFSVTFSCDEEARKKIQEDFLKYLKQVQKTVHSAGTEEVFQINFDLFSWTK